MTIRFKGGVLAAAALTALLAAGPALSQTMLRYADYGPNRGARAESVEAFLTAVEAKSEGRIKIERHWAQALLPATKVLGGIANGVASIGTVTASYTPQELFGYRVGDLPLRNPHEVAGALALYELSTTNPQLKAEFDRAGVVYIANYSVGPIQMICNGAPLVHVEDFKGRKVRAVGDWNQIYAAFGSTAVPLSLSQAYQAMDSGLIDCSQTYGYTTESYKLYEVGTSFTEINGGTIQSNGIFFNKREFEALDPADQAMILAEGRAMTVAAAEAVRERNRAVIDQLPKGFDGHVISVTRFSEEDLAKLDAAGEPFVQAYIAESKKYGIDGAALVSEFKALIAKNMKDHAN